MLEFDAAQHQYRIDGREVPSVTQLVAPLGADADEPPEDSPLELAIEAAAERGITMHAYLAHRLTGGAAEDFELPEQYSPYAEAVELFLAEHTITPLLVEEPLPGPGFAGTPDLVCEFDGHLAILDYKFVSLLAKARVSGQLGGYQALCEHNELFPEALYAVQFCRDGTYRLYPVDTGTAAESFHACRFIYKLKTKAHRRGHID